MSRTASRDVSHRVWLGDELKGANETTRIVHASRKFQKLLGWLCFRVQNVGLCFSFFKNKFIPQNQVQPFVSCLKTLLNTKQKVCTRKTSRPSQKSTWKGEDSNPRNKKCFDGCVIRNLDTREKKLIAKRPKKVKRSQKYHTHLVASTSKRFTIAKTKENS